MIAKYNDKTVYMSTYYMIMLFSTIWYILVHLGRLDLPTNSGVGEIFLRRGTIDSTNVKSIPPVSNSPVKIV